MIVTKNKFESAFKIAGNWAEHSNTLKSKFPQLTDSDLKWETGKENDLLKRVGTRLNKRREEVIKLIKESEPAKS